MDFGSGISAVAETAFELVKLLFGGVADAGAAAFDTALSPADRRKRALYACLKLLLPVGLAVAIAWWLIAEHRERTHIETTKTLVTEYADQLHRKRDANGCYVRGKSDRADAWNRPLVIRYENHKLVESLHVISAGSDSEIDTRDDIAAQKQHVLGKHVAKEIGKALGDKVKGLLEKDQVETP
ncbi:MAG: hypothetical protein WBD20_15245 [Pirellulaceae bacterium]